MTLLLALLTTAHAVDPTDVTSYNGTYDLWCEAAHLGLDLSVAIGAGGASGSWTTSAQADLPCSPSRARLRAAAERVYQDCLTAGLDPLVCEDVGRELFRQLLPLQQLGTTLMPTAMRWTVTNASDPLAQLLHVYDVAAAHRWADGRQERWNYLIDPTQPAGAHFAALGLAAAPLGGSTGAGCSALGTAAIDGWVFDDATLNADWALDQRVLCAGVGTTGEWLVITLGLQVQGEMGGAQR
jgi:hypothetical protein